MNALIKNSANKGWLKSYINFFKEFSQTNEFRDFIHRIKVSQNPDDFIYKSVQPTGLMYGFPLKFSDRVFHEMENWDDAERIKVILIDCFINCALFFKNKGISDEIDVENMLNEVTLSIGEFYNHVFPTIVGSKEVAEVSDVEGLIDNRVLINGHSWNKSFWAGYFQNSLLFLDIIYFSKWMQETNKARLQKEKEDIYFLIIKIIAASANANSQLENEEQTLFENFLKSAKMKEEKIKMANDYFYNGITLESIDFSGINSWIIKKYLLEIAILTIWSDRILDQYERIFLVSLNKKLGFSDEEFEQSMIAIESFVLSHWEELPYMKDKNNYNALYDNLLERMSAVIIKNLRRYGKEVSESKKLIELLSKSAKEELVAEEKELVKIYLMDIVKEIPSFAIFLLPGGSIILPQLLKELPKHILHSGHELTEYQ